MSAAISRNLRRLREGAKLHQAEVAKVVGIGVKAYQSYEEGRANPKIETLIKLSKFYCVTVDDLITQKPEENEING